MSLFSFQNWLRVAYWYFTMPFIFNKTVPPNYWHVNCPQKWIGTYGPLNFKKEIYNILLRCQVCGELLFFIQKSFFTLFMILSLLQWRSYWIIIFCSWKLFVMVFLVQIFRLVIYCFCWFHYPCLEIIYLLITILYKLDVWKLYFKISELKH